MSSTPSKVYIAGPMTGLPQFNFPAFEKAAATLRSAGLQVVSPHEDNDTTQPREFYIRRGIRQLLDCDSIYMLPGWKESAGARLELDIALNLGLFVFGYAFEPGEAQHG